MGEYEDRTGCVYFVGVQQKNQSLKEGIPFVLAGKQVYLPLLELGYFIDYENKSVEDPLSVVLSLTETEKQDERVKIAIKEMLEEYVW